MSTSASLPIHISGRARILRKERKLFLLTVIQISTIGKSAGEANPYIPYYPKMRKFSAGKCFVDLFVLISFLTDELTRSLFNIAEISNSYFKSPAVSSPKDNSFAHLVARLACAEGIPSENHSGLSTSNVLIRATKKRSVPSLWVSCWTGCCRFRSSRGAKKEFLVFAPFDVLCLKFIPFATVVCDFWVEGWEPNSEVYMQPITVDCLCR